MSKIKIIGHRGACGLAPENTIAGLRKAIQHHAHQIEFDIRVTADNVPILIHDTFLTDPSGNQLNIHDHTYAELKQHKADLPTLKEVLDKLGRIKQLYIEIKPNEPTQPIITTIKQSVKDGVPNENLQIASYSYAILKKIHQALPQISILVIDRWSGVRATHRARKLHTKHISMNQRWLWPGFIKAMKQGGYLLYPYTMNDPVKAQAWSKYGIAGVVTDYPDRYESVE
jgi:glycerophosphoryl diester phosphodiesterase